MTVRYLDHAIRVRSGHIQIIPEGALLERAASGLSVRCVAHPRSDDSNGVSPR